MRQVRVAKENNIGDIVRMVGDFNHTYYDQPLNAAKCVNTVTHLINSPNGVALIGDEGFILGIAVPSPWHNHMIMSELGWWSMKRQGLELLSMFEDTALDLGCFEINMTTLYANSRVDALLTRRGYTTFERSHRKLLQS